MYTYEEQGNDSSSIDEYGSGLGARFVPHARHTPVTYHGRHVQAARRPAAHEIAKRFSMPGMFEPLPVRYPVSPTGTLRYLNMPEDYSGGLGFGFHLPSLPGLPSLPTPPIPSFLPTPISPVAAIKQFRPPSISELRNRLVSAHPLMLQKKFLPQAVRIASNLVKAHPLSIAARLTPQEMLRRQIIARQETAKRAAIQAQQQEQARRAAEAQHYVQMPPEPGDGWTSQIDTGQGSSGSVDYGTASPIDTSSGYDYSTSTPTPSPIAAPAPYTPPPSYDYGQVSPGQTYDSGAAPDQSYNYGSVSPTDQSATGDYIPASDASSYDQGTQYDTGSQYDNISPAQSGGGGYDLTSGSYGGASGSDGNGGDNTMQGVGNWFTEAISTYQATQKPSTVTVAADSQKTDLSTGGLPGILSSLVGVWQQKKIVDINTDRLKQGLPPIDSGAVSPSVNIGLDPKLRTMLVMGGAGALGLLGWMVYKRKRG